MKLQINSTEKIIRLEEQVNLGELFTFLEEILPDFKWREYSIEGNVVYNVSNPIVVNPVTPYAPIVPIYPNVPYSPTVPNPNYPWVTYCTSKDDNDVPGIGGTSFTISYTSST